MLSPNPRKKILYALAALVVLFLAVSQSGLAARISLPALVFDKIRAFLSDEHTSLSAADYKAGTIILIKPIATGVGEGRYEAGDIVEIRDGEELYNKFGHGSFLGAEEKSKLVPFYLNHKLTAEQKEELMAPVSDNSVILRPQAEESHGASSVNEILRPAQDDQGTSNENPQPPLLKEDEGRLDSKMNGNKGMIKRRQYGIDYTLVLSDQDILAIRQEQPLDKIPEVKFEQIMNKEKKLSYFVIARSMATKQSANVNDASKIAALPSVTRNNNQKKPGSDSVVCLPKHLAITENIINITKQIKNQLIPTAYAVPTETVKVVDPGNGSGTDYLSLNAWEAAQEQDLVTNDAIAVAKCRATNATPDTTAVTISGWTTSSTTYIKIWTDPTEPYRHEGKWDDRKYRIEMSNTWLDAFNLIEEYIKIEGLQIGILNPSSGSGNGIDIDANNITISANLIRGVMGGGAPSGISAGFLNNIYIYNNVVYGFKKSSNDALGTGIYIPDSTAYVYNNTVVDCGYGFYGANSVPIAKNNISYNNEDNYYYGFNATSTNNLSGPTQTDAPGSNPQNGVSIVFVDETNYDFHLAQSDTGAKSKGTSSVPGIPELTADIDGSSRTGTWDIGADEAAIPIFYSVGQNTDDHKTGSPNITISSGVGTFSVAQTAVNMGVGDKVTYNTSSVAFISEKISNTQWKLVTKTGGAPNDVSSPQTVNSIAHPFASLFNAEGGADDGTYLGTDDLVAGNYQVNIPCYYDTGPDTTGGVILGGWVTNHANYVKIYTPNNTATEANQSQRHSGKWDERKYRMEITDGNGILSSINFYIIDGLQIKIAETLVSGSAIRINTISSSNNKFLISNNILRGSISGSANGNGFYVNTDSAITYFWNNLVYDFINDTVVCRGAAVGYIAYAYNNTLINNYYGLNSGGAAIAKNNIVKGSGNTYAYFGTFAAGTDYNATDGTDNIGQGTHNKISQTFSFINDDRDDYRLSLSDEAAKDSGTNLSADSYLPFATDIEGQIRSSIWDIGADEVKTAVINSDRALPQSLASGLAGYWSFNGPDMGTTSANDLSGNNNTGWLLDGAKKGVGISGQAINFDGADDKVSVYPGTSINNLSAMTISAWVYTKSYGENGLGCIISKESNFGKGWYFRSTQPYSNLYFGIDYDGADLKAVSAQSSFSSADFNRWVNIIVVWDGSANASGVTFYKNGVLLSHMTSEETDASGNRVNDTDSYLQIGNNYFGSRTFDGLIDDVRVYNRVLSVNEAKELYDSGAAKTKINTPAATPVSLTSGLVGYWPLNGPDVSWNNNIVYDRSGQGNNGTMISMSTTTSPKAGVAGQSLYFNGVSQYVSISDSDSLRDLPNSALTLSAWLKISNNGAFGHIFSKHTNSTTNGWSFMVDNYRRAQFYIKRATTDLNVLSDINQVSDYNNGWFFIAVTYPGGDEADNVLIYVNGSEVTDYQIRTDGVGSYMSDNGLTARVGRSGYNNNLNGHIDEARIYNRALSADEVLELYNLSAQRKVVPGNR